MKKNREAVILGTGSHVPEHIMINEDLEKMVDTSDEWITTRTGIKERHIAEPDTLTADLAVAAAEKALRQAGVDAEDLDMIIVATATADTVVPSLACAVQHRLGATHAGAFDIIAGCSGFVYGLAIGSQMIMTGMQEKILVIGAEIMSRFIDWTDRNTCVLFGDGAGAAVLGASDQEGVIAMDLGSDGGGKNLLGIFGGQFTGEDYPDLKEEKMYVKMNGLEVFKFATKIINTSARRALEKCNLSTEDISLFIPHQANIRIIEAAAKKLDLPSEKIFVNVKKYGNTSAAALAIALDEAIHERKPAVGDIIVLNGFGAGLTWATLIYKWME